MCEPCGRWQHRVCHTEISRQDYRRAVRGEMELDWQCQCCHLHERCWYNREHPDEAFVLSCPEQDSGCGKLLGYSDGLKMLEAAPEEATSDLDEGDTMDTTDPDLEKALAEAYLEQHPELDLVDNMDQSTDDPYEATRASGEDLQEPDLAEDMDASEYDPDEAIAEAYLAQHPELAVIDNDDPEPAWSDSNVEAANETVRIHQPQSRDDVAVMTGEMWEEGFGAIRRTTKVERLLLVSTRIQPHGSSGTVSKRQWRYVQRVTRTSEYV